MNKYLSIYLSVAYKKTCVLHRILVYNNNARNTRRHKISPNSKNNISATKHEYCMYNIYYENGMLIYRLNKLILIQNKQSRDF